jgi:hypothetical protein
MMPSPSGAVKLTDCDPGPGILNVLDLPLCKSRTVTTEDVVVWVSKRARLPSPDQATRSAPRVATVVRA